MTKVASAVLDYVRQNPMCSGRALRGALPFRSSSIAAELILLEAEGRIRNHGLPTSARWVADGAGATPPGTTSAARQEPNAAPVDPIEERRDKRRIKALQEQLEELQARLERELARNSLVNSLQSAQVESEIERREVRSGLREGTVVLLASDWHIEEKVEAENVEHMNEYNLDVAQRRVSRFFQASRQMTDYARQSHLVRDMVLALAGDMITGQIHPELMMTNELQVGPALLLLRDLLISGIRYLLEDTQLERLVIPCVPGNHGRMMAKQPYKVRCEMSFEWLVYQMLAQEFAAEPRVTVQCGKSAHEYLRVYNTTVHVFHGDDIRYNGGVGGVAVPLNRAIPRWNEVRHADLHMIGHFHQYQHLRHAVVNGSIIGTTEYSRQYGHEPPQQAFFVIDSKRGRCLKTPLWVDDTKEPEAAKQASNEPNRRSRWRRTQQAA